MSLRNDLAYRSGNRLVGAGIAIGTLADLLGADGSDHYLTSSDINGLLHAVSALADMVKRDGYDLCEAFDPEPQPAQHAVEDLDEALAAAGKPTAKRKGGAE